MASQGPNSTGTSVVDTSFGTLGWNTVGNTLTSNDAYADSGTTAPSSSHYIKATNFGFSIPSGATIDGIVVEIERKTNNTANTYKAKDSRVRIVKGGTIQTTDLADTGTIWPITDTYKTYGSSSELWGTTWTDTDINSSTFGVVISASLRGLPGKFFSYAYVDHIRITVHYTEGGGGGSTSKNQVVII